MASGFCLAKAGDCCAPLTRNRYWLCGLKPPRRLYWRTISVRWRPRWSRPSRLPPRATVAEHQNRVQSAEREGVGERPFNVGRARHVGDHVQRARRIALREVGGRRNQALVKSQERGGGFERSGGTQRVPVH